MKNPISLAGFNTI